MDDKFKEIINNRNYHNSDNFDRDLQTELWETVRLETCPNSPTPNIITRREQLITPGLSQIRRLDNSLIVER